MSYSIRFTPKGREDYDAIKDGSHDLRKITELIEVMEQTPISGIGKPKPLRGSLSGLYSRRINSKDRLVYQVDEEKKEIQIVACKGHYD